MIKHFRSHPRTCHSFALVETAIAVVIFALAARGVLIGQQLISNTRVRNLTAQQTAVESAFEAFQDRYHALSGDCAGASTVLNCGETASLDGNGMVGSNQARQVGWLREDILAWST